MENRDFIKVGRGHDSEVRITDISVSRCHSLIKKSAKGEYIVEDNNSKFGTLILARKPYMLNKSGTNYI
jgi:pSer/pThr/pTyr-binding forkhead associated (FHA) protein